MTPRVPLGSTISHKCLIAVGCVIAFALVACVGCAKKASPDDSRAKGILRLVGIEYGRYMAQHRDRRPADETRFRDFLRSRQERLTSLGVDGLDELFVSPRDGEPLVLLTGPGREPISPYGNPWVAYEQTGVDGTRMAVSSRGTIVELAQDEFDAAFSGEAASVTRDDGEPPQ